MLAVATTRVFESDGLREIIKPTSHYFKLFIRGAFLILHERALRGFSPRSESCLKGLRPHSFASLSGVFPLGFVSLRTGMLAITLVHSFSGSLLGVAV